MSTNNTMSVEMLESAAAPPVEEKKECLVCMSPYTNVIRQPIKCPYCPQEACRQCASRYLLTTLNDPHCMGCKREWNKDFIDTNLTQVFRKGPLKAHRKAVLLDREKGKMPAAQTIIEARNEYKIVEDEECKLMQNIYANQAQIRRNKGDVELVASLKIKIAELNEEVLVKSRRRRELREIISGNKAAKKEFIMKCHAEDCRGFLSTAWKCGVCEKYFCSECHAEKSGKDDSTHVCEESAKETAKLIRKETKPCPKCGIRISKIDGCDQMWCTSCHTTFSWNTGEILLNTVVHNPHYYEYLRKVGNGYVPREAADIPCGGLPGAYSLARYLDCEELLYQNERDMIMRIYRCIAELNDFRLRLYRTRPEVNANLDIDIDFLKNEIDENKLASMLLLRETKFENRKEIGLILETLVHVGTEKMGGLYNMLVSKIKDVDVHTRNIIKEMEHIRRYTNQSLINIGKKLNLMVPQYDSNWLYETVKTDKLPEDDYLEKNCITENYEKSYMAPPALPPIETAPLPRANAGAGGPPQQPEQHAVDDGYDTDINSFDQYTDDSDEELYVQFGDEMIQIPAAALK